MPRADGSENLNKRNTLVQRTISGNMRVQIIFQNFEFLSR